MADTRIVLEPDTVVVVDQAPEVVQVERERSAQATHETMIIRGDDRSRLSPSMLLGLVLGFMLVAGLIYTMATSGDDTSATDGLNLSIDVAAPQLPTIVEVDAPDVERPSVKTDRSDLPAEKVDTSIAPGEPLEPVEPAEAD